MPASAGKEPDPLAAAYEQRTMQLHEARGALAEAVSALRVELEQLREQSAELRMENAALRVETASLGDDNRALRDDNEKLREQADTLEAELRSADGIIGQLQNMKVVRWTAWARRIVYRRRKQRG
jgi:chromosome segregation ATPase